MEARIAVMASGVGSNLQALLDDASVGPRIVLVLSDREGAGALRRAAERGIRAAWIPPDRPSREDYDRALLEVLRDERIDTIVLAGFMRILSSVLVRAFEGRIVNVHPSLLPAFPGAHAPRDALAWGVKVTGVTVHLVDEELDHGPILAQEAVPVLPDDDEESLHARIRTVEHRLYPRAVRDFLEGRVRLDGRRVTVEGAVP